MLCNSLRRPQRKSLRLRLFASRIGQYLSANKIFGSIFRQWLPLSHIFEIERLPGGGFNRIIGINVLCPFDRRDKIEHQFILRIPRFEDARPDREVAAMNLVQKRTNIPIAKIMAKDFSCNNALGKPYMIQRRIPGKDLQMTWTDLTHGQRCTVAREYAKTLLILQSLTNATAGLIDTDIKALNGHRYTVISPYELKNGQGLVEEPNADQVYRDQDTSTLDFFIHQMNRWRAVDLKKSGGDMDSYNVALWDSLMDAARDMGQFGLFKEDTTSLCHLDLQPRNIMAEIQKDQSLSITGYLDWDSAVFAPKFVSCAPPRWLWADEGGEYDEDDERGANDVPSTPEKQE